MQLHMMFYLILKFSETIRYELVAKKCWPILLYGIGAINVDQIAVYRLYVAYRKIFRYIFNLPLWAHISELLEVFIIESVENIICLKRQRINLYIIHYLSFQGNCLFIFTFYV